MGADKPLHMYMAGAILSRKLHFIKKREMYLYIISSVAAAEISSVATEEISHVAAESCLPWSQEISSIVSMSHSSVLL